MPRRHRPIASSEAGQRANEEGTKSSPHGHASVGRATHHPRDLGNFGLGKKGDMSCFQEKRGHAF